MADPRDFVEEMNDSLREGERGNSPRGGSSDDDIRQTAHFTHYQMGNMNELQDSFNMGARSPIANFQPLNANNMSGLTSSNQNSLRGLDSQNLSNSYRTNQQVSNTSGGRNIIQQNLVDSKQIGKQSSRPESLISKKTQQTQIQNLNKMQATITQQSHQLQNTQYNTQKTIILHQGQFSQNSSQSLNQQSLQNSGQRQANLQSSQSPPVYQGSSTGTTNVNQIPTHQASSRTNEQSQNSQPGINYIQAGQTELYHSEPIEASQNSTAKVARVQTFGEGNADRKQEQTTLKQAYAQREVIKQNINNSTNSTKNISNIQLGSPVHNPNRYFPISTQQIQPGSSSNIVTISRSTQLQQPQAPVQNIIVSQPIQVVQRGQVEVQHQNVPIVSQSPITYINVSNPEHEVLPYLPQQIQQSPIIIQRPQSPQVLLNNPGHQTLHLRQTVGSPINISLSQRPSFFHNQIINQQSQVNPSRSQSPQRPVENRESRASVSYGSNDSRRRVSFTYLNNIQPTQPIVIPNQNQVQVIREHTHSHTVVQKTVTVVWQYRYWTVIQKYNFLSQRFNQLTNELRAVTQLLQNAKSREKFQENYHNLLMRHTILLQLLSQIQHDMHSFEEQSSEFKKEIEHEAELKQHILYKDKCRTLEEEIVKSQTLNNELTNYIARLENDNHILTQEIERLKTGQTSGVSSQHMELIRNQQLIIRELENSIKKKDQELQQNSQQYVALINQLQARVKQLEDTDLKFNPQYSERKYTQIIQTQRNIIENIETHFREFTQGANTREEELKGILKNQESIIHGLQEQLKKTNFGQPGGISKERQQTLLHQIQASKAIIQELQIELEKETNRTNSLKEDIISKTQQINVLIQEKATIEAKFQQKLYTIQQELRMKYSGSYGDKTTQDHTNCNRQIQELTEEVNRLSAEVKKRQQEKRKLEEEYINQEEGLRRKLMEKESEVRLLNDKLSMIEDEGRRKVAEKEKRIKILEEQIENLNYKLKSNVKTPKNEPNYDIFSPSKNDQEARSLRDKLSQKEQQLNDAIRQRENYEKKLQSLQNNYNLLDEQNSRKNQELISLKRQISNVSSYELEIKTLSESLTKKNQEILELKGLTFERNELKVQLQAIKNERNVLKQTIQTKNQEVQKIRETINQLQTKLRESKLKQSLYPNTNQSVADELQLMYESVKKKEAELTKLKQSNQLLETNVQQLEYELERAKNKLTSMEKNLAHEKEEFADRISGYQAKIREFESKVKSSDEVHKQFKSGFEHQIQTLENLVKEKQDIIRKLQGQIKVLKNKLKNHDSKVQQVDFEREALNNKIKQLETMREDMKKKINTLEQSGQNNNKQLYDNYQIKIVELEAALKVKDNKIKQLENNIETMKIKADHTHPTSGDDFINQQQIQVLRKKIAQYESRIYSQNNARNSFNNYKLRDYESSYVFEQKIIYDLKSENERLRSLLSGKGIRYTEDSPSSKTGNVAFIQKRLIDFNQKLEEMIEENKNLEERNGNFSPLFSPKNNSQLLQSFERQRAAIYRRHRGQISALQARMVDLQRYCSSLENFQSNSVYNVTSQTKTVVNDNIKGVYSEQLTYYREKNKELEDRIDSHIKLNRELKEKLQGMLKNSGADPNSLEFYKIQATQYQREIAEYLARIKELTEQVNSLTRNLNDSRRYNESESKISELENKIHELNRKISQLQMQNGILEADLSKYIQELKNASDEALRYKTGGQDREQKIIVLENSLRQANSKVSSYEMQVVKLTNQIKLLQSEIQRLNEKAQYRQGEENAQITKLKTKLAQLQSEIRQYQEHSSMWNEAKVQYEQTIAMLNNRISNLEADISRLNSLYENLNKKARETENEFYELENKFKIEKNRAAQLEASLKRRQLDADGMNEFLERIKRERDNEGAQSKQRLTYIAELQETIKTLRVELAQCKSQLQRLRSQSSLDKERLSQMNNMEEIIKQLRMEIKILKTEIQRLKLENSQLKAQAGDRASLVEGLAYRLQFLRSSFIEVEVLVGEISINADNPRQIQVIKEVRQSISGGLNICSETFALL